MAEITLLQKHEHCFCRQGIGEFYCCDPKCFVTKKEKCPKERHCFCDGGRGKCCRCGEEEA